MYRFALVLLVVLAGRSLAWQEKPVVIRDYTVSAPRITSAPVIDGKLDDACWKAEPQIAGMMFRDSFKPADPQTSVSLACDDKGLYVAFRCSEPEMDKLVGSNPKDIWLNDCIEIYIDADRDRGLTHHFVVDAQGRKMEETIQGDNWDKSWSAPWEAAVALGDKEWTAEVFIPWKTVGIAYHQGEAIRANFGRNRRINGSVSAWYATPDGFHKPNRFGNVILDIPMSSVTSDLRFLSDATAGHALGNLILSTYSKHSTVTPVIKVLPGPKPVILKPVTVPTDTDVPCPITLTMPESRLYDVDVFVKPEGVETPVFVDGYQVQLPVPIPGAVLGSYDWGYVWEASATSKIRPTDYPIQHTDAIRISAAGNEHEPFQISIKPNRELKNLKASASALGAIPAENISIKLVQTVPVTIPTGEDCVIGDYPDPLPPFKPTTIPAARNTILWITVYVPPNTKAGDYNGTVTLSADGIQPVSFPVILHVWGFSLPKVSHLRTAYGGDAGTLSAWHGAKTREEQRQIARLFNQDFIEHRMSPYSPMTLNDPKVTVVGEEVRVDWTDFDAAMSEAMPYMNSFNVPQAWMSDFMGIKQGTPEYRKIKGEFIRQMAAHLREKGWFDKAYIYIYDEPEPDAYQRIVEEAKMWHEADPGYRVLLTEQPEKALAPQVNIYVPVLPNYKEAPCKDRQAAGDQVWWYVCCGPHHPYPNNFIDYPAIDHRILHWINWKYGVTGVLYWSTMWWQDNPWTTPMSYTPDHGGTWGNGDGHLLYPAVKSKSDTPVIEGPVDSIRWEMIREGVEDYDYLYMLNEAVKRGGNPKAVLAGKKALAAAESLVRDRTDYEKDPARLYAVRAQVAEALERLSKQ